MPYQQEHNLKGTNPVNFNDMKLPELKAEAKKRNLKGYSTMKKAELLAALEATVKPKAESMVDAIKAALRNAREERSNKGRKASALSVSTEKKTPAAKAAAFALQRGSTSAKLTKAQQRRVRKSERAFC